MSQSDEPHGATSATTHVNSLLWFATLDELVLFFLRSPRKSGTLDTGRLNSGPTLESLRGTQNRKSSPRRCDESDNVHEKSLSLRPD